MPEPRQQRTMLTKASRIGLSVLVPAMKGPVVTGVGGIDFICPGCRTVLLKSVDEWTIHEMGIKCFECGTLAYTPPPL